MLNPTASLLFFYGLFLISCGIVAVVFIGLKAKTALISGGTSGLLAMTAGHFVNQGSDVASVLGISLTLFLTCIFSWRSTKTLFTLFDFIRTDHPDLKGKAIAFLIISLMAAISVTVSVLQAVHLTTNH